MQINFFLTIIFLGLKYEDVLSEACPAVQAAVSRLDGEVSLARTRRIKRAIDTSAKKKTMPSEATNYNPYEVRNYSSY